MKDIFFVILILMTFIFTLKMAHHVFYSNLSITAKIIWILGMFMAPLLGATLYFISDHSKA